MNILATMTVAAAVGLTALGVPTVSYGVECLELCLSGPPRSLLSESRDNTDECQRKINDSGGFCTNNGRLNLGKDLPRGWNYKPQDYYPKRYIYAR